CGARRLPTPRVRRIHWRAPSYDRLKKRGPPYRSRSPAAPTGSNCSRQALIDETHRLGKKTGCHVYGGDGQKNAIVAGCDTIEHGFGLDQAQVNMMVEKHLFYDPTIVRYTEPNMDDTDTKNTGGKYR